MQKVPGSNPSPGIWAGDLVHIRSVSRPLDHEAWWKKLAFIFNMYYLHVKISQFSQKTSASQTHFGFTNIGSGMPTFRDRAIWKSKFWFGSPCRFYLHKQFVLLQIVLCIQIISFLCKTVYAWTGQYIDIHISWSVTIWEFYLHKETFEAEITLLNQYPC